MIPVLRRSCAAGRAGTWEHPVPDPRPIRS